MRPSNWLAPWTRIAALVLVAATGHAPLAGQGRATALDTIVPRIDQWARAVMDTSGIPAISIAVVRHRKVVWTEAYGFSNVAEQVRATPETYFSTGSTFKFVTAAAVMQLVENGLVTLDTPLNAILGADLAVAEADDVTLRHVLTHYSGLEGPAHRVPLWSHDGNMSAAELLKTITRVGPPGTEYRYCNACFGVLGYVVEKVSGETYDRYIASHVLLPLRIESGSTTVPGPSVVERMALPYDVKDGVAVPIAQVRFSGRAAGDVYSRPSDMARFLVAMLNGGVYEGARILESASVSEMETAQYGNQGLGISLSDFSGHRILIHNGSIPGFKSVLVADPRTGNGVYISANATQGARSINLLARYVMLLLWNESFVPPSR